MKHIKLLLIVLLGSVTMGYGQIYSENFTSQNGKGAIGPGGATPTIDLTGVSWNIDVSSSNLSATTDWFQVVSEVFEAHDVDGPSIWFSPSINISAHTNVFFNLDVTEAGNKEMTDTFDTEYRIDGGAWTTAATNGNLSDDFLNTTVSQTGLSGNTLEIRITINNNADGEFHRFDNIIVDGTLLATTTLVEFVSTTSTLAEDGVFIDVCVAITNEDATNATTVEIDLDGASTATNGTDYDDGAGVPAAIPFPQTLTFPAGSSMNECLTIYISNDDAVFESSETVILNLQNVSGSNAVALGTNTQHTLTITDNDLNPCSELMISEYHEGTSNEKYLELYNSSSTTIDLSNYDLSIYFNGSTTASQTINLSGTLTAYQTQVYQVSGATLYTGNTVSSNVINFNGNDVIALSYTGGLIIDIIGTIGNVSNFAQNVSLKRKANVLKPNPNYTISEWTSSSLVDDISGIGSHISDCQTVCNSSTPVVWNGSWSNGTGPTASDNVELNFDYNTGVDGSITACSLTINATNTLTIEANSFVQITNDINNIGTLVVAEAGSLVQVTNTASFINSSGETIPVTVVRKTADADAWYEYTYWSSPVPETTLENLLPLTSASRILSFNGSNFVDNKAEIGNSGNYTLNAQDDIDDNGNDWEFASGIMTPGKGYAATLGVNELVDPFGSPITNGILKNFEGNTVNTGIITIPVVQNDSILDDNNWNLIGNPYPSAIDVDLFFAENRFDSNPNAMLHGSIYLWSHDTAPSATTSGNEPLNFDVNDYAVINLSTVVAGEDGLTPERTIGTGQGFFVIVDNNAPLSGNVTFKNAMRVTGDNKQFYRANTSNLDNKFWLNLTSDNGVFSQLAVAYVEGASNGDDGPSYDARRFYSGGSAMLVSFAENSDVTLAIQGKQPNALDLDEIITLGFTTGITSPTIYTISIDHFQGDFLTNNTIYLKDKLTATIHDLSASNYSFTSQTGKFNDRFEVVFNNANLSSNHSVLNENNLSLIELQNDNVLFKTGSELTIKSVQIFDVLGRNLYTFKGNSNTETFNLANLSQSAYVAQVVLSNGQTISKKAIKK